MGLLGVRATLFTLPSVGLDKGVLKCITKYKSPVELVSGHTVLGNSPREVYALMLLGDSG